MVYLLFVYFGGFDMRHFNFLWLCLLLFFTFSGEVLAASYSWHHLTNPNIYGSTPMEACIRMNSGNPTGMTFQMGSSGIDGNCLYNGVSYNGYIQRRGDSCPVPGQTYSTTTGSCSCPAGTALQNGQCVAVNPCTSKNGQSQSFTKSGSSGDGYGTVSGGYVAGVQSACFGGCAVSTVDQKCVGRVSGLYTCRGTAYHTGQVCSGNGAGTEIQDNTSQAPPPVPQVITENKPCVYSGTGDTQTCTSSEGSEKEGQYCGTVNGVKKCVDSKPTKNGIEIQTTFKTETKPDGSKTTTKTDVATKTTCTGAGQCSSTSTTTTTTTKTDGSGKTTSVTGSCTGDACPDENGNPDGDGDGFGDCVGDDCGEGGGGDFSSPELEELDGYEQTTKDFYGRAKSSPILSAVSGISAPTSGVAPNFQSDPIQALGGARADFGIIGQLVPNIDFLALVMKAVWCFVAVVVFLLA